jgi:hypothetical protein
MRELTEHDRESVLLVGLPLGFAGDEEARLEEVRNTVLKALPGISDKAHQRVIRERLEAQEPRPQMRSLAGCWVEPIGREEAEAIILKYEWLGTMGRSVATYGLRGPGGELLGTAVFGWPSAVQSRDICGKENRELAVCLERGACVHYAPSNAASFLISHAVKQAAHDRGWRIFYAYADPEAGEIGTVYQAVNWLYIGQGVGRTPGRLREDWRLPDGTELSSRSLRHRKMKRADALALGWKPVYKHPKHKYIHFEGTRPEREALLRALRYPVQSYPKRDIAATPASAEVTA